MRRIRFITSLVIAVTLTGLCACAEEEPDIRAVDEQDIRAVDEQDIRAADEQDIRAADEQAIRAAEMEAVVAFNAGDIDGYMASYPVHAMWLPPNAPMVRGAQAIRELAAKLAANPGFEFDVQLDTVEVALEGDLAYLVGFYLLTLNDANGKPVTDYGKFVEVWKKQSDNTWGHQLAIWNSDGPPP